MSTPGALCESWNVDVCAVLPLVLMFVVSVVTTEFENGAKRRDVF